MVEALDEAIADCLHYFGTDITRLPGHRAVPLLRSLPEFWQVIAGTDPPVWRSAVRAALVQRRDEAAERDEEHLISAAEFEALGGEYRKG